MTATLQLDLDLAEAAEDDRASECVTVGAPVHDARFDRPRHPPAGPMALAAPLSAIKGSGD